LTDPFPPGVPFRFGAVHESAQWIAAFDGSVFHYWFCAIPEKGDSEQSRNWAIRAKHYFDMSCQDTAGIISIKSCQ
jgi:hypothetical protein